MSFFRSSTPLFSCSRLIDLKLFSVHSQKWSIYVFGIDFLLFCFILHIWMFVSCARLSRDRFDSQCVCIFFYSVQFKTNFVIDSLFVFGLWSHFFFILPSIFAFVQRIGYLFLLLLIFFYFDFIYATMYILLSFDH